MNSKCSIIRRMVPVKVLENEVIDLSNGTRAICKTMAKDLGVVWIPLSPLPEKKGIAWECQACKDRPGRGILRGFAYKQVMEHFDGKCPFEAHKPPFPIRCIFNRIVHIPSTIVILPSSDMPEEGEEIVGSEDRKEV